MVRSHRHAREHVSLGAMKISSLRPLSLGPILLSAAALNGQPARTIQSAAGTSATIPLPAPIESGIQARRLEIFNWSVALEESHNNSGGLKHTPYDIVAQTARDGCGQPGRAQFMTALGKMGITDTTKPIAFEMFSLPGLVRYLYLFGDCMSAAQKTELLTGLSKTPRGLFPHGTINHMIMQQSSWYLLAQYFPDATWLNLDGKKFTSAEVMRRGKELIARRDWRFFQSAQNEALSPTYAETNFFPLLNLIDFSKDTELSGWARNEATLGVLLMKAHSFHGLIVPPLTRRNQDQTNAPLYADYPLYPSMSPHILWYYFGEPRIGQYDMVKKVREPFYAVMYATSSYRPPVQAWSMPAADYAVRYVTPDFAQWDNPAPPSDYGDTWIGSNYALGTGNRIFDPTSYNDHDQTFGLVWKSTQLRNSFECREPYWNANAGEDDWSADFWSPFIENWRIDTHRALLLVDIPERDPWTTGVEDRFWKQREGHKDALIKMVACRVPRSVDELKVDGNWTFFRSGAVHVAMGALKGVFETDTSPQLTPTIAQQFSVIKLREAKSAIFVMVDDKAEPFSDFEARARKAAPAYDAASGSITTKDDKGRSLSVRFVPPCAGKRTRQALLEVATRGKGGRDGGAVSRRSGL